MALLLVIYMDDTLKVVFLAEQVIKRSSLKKQEKRSKLKVCTLSVQRIFKGCLYG